MSSEKDSGDEILNNEEQEKTLASSLELLETDSLEDLTEEQRERLLNYPPLLQRRDSLSSTVPSTLNIDPSHATSPLIKAFYDVISDGVFSDENQLVKDQSQETKLQEFIDLVVKELSVHEDKDKIRIFIELQKHYLCLRRFEQQEDYTYRK